MNKTIATHPHLVDAFGQAMAVYDLGTFEHSNRVATLARRIGTELRLESSAIEALGWAASLHDVGKLAISEQVLHKRGPLTPKEWAEVKRHPAVGSDLLRSISPKLDLIAGAVRSHHERWDGTGYPDGLAAGEIPLLGRIIALADVYDALTSYRSYRSQPFSLIEARDHVRRESGTHFDPALAPIFLAVVDSESLLDSA